MKKTYIIYQKGTGHYLGETHIEPEDLHSVERDFIVEAKIIANQKKFKEA